MRMPYGAQQTRTINPQNARSLNKPISYHMAQRHNQDMLQHVDSEF